MNRVGIFLLAALTGGIVAALTTFLWMYIGGRIPPTIVTGLLATGAGTTVAFLLHRRGQKR